LCNYRAKKLLSEQLRGACRASVSAAVWAFPMVRQSLSAAIAIFLQSADVLQN
jgi:hypothetical protein